MQMQKNTNAEQECRKERSQEKIQKKSTEHNNFVAHNVPALAGIRLRSNL
ncbi:MAG: hypothetical protein JWN14_2826 [Chthonomonadales bacterium]|nr:hypothetical protein [Chthonomonadales bacterium]